MGAAVYLVSSADNIITLNQISNITGGTGGTGALWGTGGAGGIGAGIYLESSYNLIE